MLATINCEKYKPLLIQSRSDLFEVELTYSEVELTYSRD